ncbi:hypothetical protein DLREEDagr8_06440 [Dongia sp. agr-C8]
MGAVTAGATSPFARPAVVVMLASGTKKAIACALLPSWEKDTEAWRGAAERSRSWMGGAPRGARAPAARNPSPSYG